jgi:hypothetical protein
VSDTDSDSDGTPDCSDNCPDDPDKTEPGVSGCGVAENDSDGDTVPDAVDNCPSSYNPGQNDIDGDGIGDACDNCPEESNASQTDSDLDGYGTACDCNDNDDTVSPGASEVCGDGVDQDCNGHDPACVAPWAKAMNKFIGARIPGQVIFKTVVHNPTENDITISQSFEWHGEPPDTVTVESLEGYITIGAGKYRMVEWPVLYVSPDNEPGTYSFDIPWSGYDSQDNPIQFITDPAIRTYYAPSGGGGQTVGGVATAIDKIGLLQPWIWLILTMCIVLGVVVVWRIRLNRG